MAAYDLRVQKPSSLEIPDSPGANDLARFLSVSESSRANKEKEELGQNMFDWEKGAGQRKLTAEESERERVRNRDMEFGNALKGTTEGYMAKAKENYRLADSVVSKFREKYPDATEDQVKNVRRSAIDRITQDPSYFINQPDMNRDVNLSLLQQGFSQDRAEATKNYIGSYYGTPAAPNEALMDARLEAIQNGSLIDNINAYNPSKGKSGAVGAADFMKAAKFVSDQQVYNPNNNYEKGSENWWNWDLPFTGDTIWTDQLQEMGTLIETKEGIKPLYVNAVMQGMAKDGNLPKGYSAEDMKNPESDLYKDVKQSASTLQRKTEGNNGSGGNGVGNLSLANIRELSQGSLKMKMEAFNEIGEMYRRASGGTLTAEEQYAIISDPALLKEFGVAIGESVKRPGEENNSSGNNKNAEVAKTNNTSSVATEEGDNPELTSLLEGEDQVEKDTLLEGEDQVEKATEESKKAAQAKDKKVKDAMKKYNISAEEALGNLNRTDSFKKKTVDLLSDSVDGLYTTLNVFDKNNVINQGYSNIGSWIDPAFYKSSNWLLKQIASDRQQQGTSLLDETNKTAMTLEQDLERIMNMSDKDMKSDNLFSRGLDMAKRLKAKGKSGEDTAKEQQSLVNLLPVPARKAYELLSTIQSGRGSDQQVKELMAMLDLAKK